MNKVEAYRKRRDWRLARRGIRLDDFNENDHPRDENGRFTSGGSGGEQKPKQNKAADGKRIGEKLSKVKYDKGAYKRMADEYEKTAESDVKKRSQIIEDMAVQVMNKMDKSDAVSDFFYDYDYEEYEGTMPTKAEIVEENVDRIMEDDEDLQSVKGKTAQKLKEDVKKYILDHAEAFCTMSDNAIYDRAMDRTYSKWEEEERKLEDERYAEAEERGKEARKYGRSW